MSESASDLARLPLTILVVDDDHLNQRMMLVLLKREGHLVECVSNGAEAVEAVKAKPYDIVLMDLQMPVMDGVTASRYIRDWEDGNGHTFIVALTASYMPEKGRELYEAGMDNYLTKPFDLAHLRNILEYGLENRKKRLNALAAKAPVDLLASDQELDIRIGIQHLGGDRETYRELLQDFVRDLPGRLDDFWLCYKNKDMDGLNRAAHNLKGIASSLGALQLSEYARRLEKQVGEGYNEPVEGLLQAVAAAIVRLKANVQDFLTSQEAPVDQ